MSKASNTNHNASKTPGNYKAAIIWKNFYLSLLPGTEPTIENKKWKFEYKNRRRITISHAKANLSGKEYWDSAIRVYESEVENPTLLEDVNTAQLVALSENSNSMGIRLLICKILSWMIQDLQKQVKQSRDAKPDTDSTEESDDDGKTANTSTVNSATIAKAIVNETNFKDILNTHAANIISAMQDRFDSQQKEINDKLNNHATTQANSRYKRNVTREFEDQIRQLKFELKQQQQKNEQLQTQYDKLRQAHSKLLKRNQTKRKEKREHGVITIYQKHITSYSGLSDRYDALSLYENYLFPKDDKQMQTFKMRKKQQEVESDSTTYNRMHNKWLKRNN